MGGAVDDEVDIARPGVDTDVLGHSLDAKGVALDTGPRRRGDVEVELRVPVVRAVLARDRRPPLAGEAPADLDVTRDRRVVEGEVATGDDGSGHRRVRDRGGVRAVETAFGGDAVQCEVAAGGDRPGHGQRRQVGVAGARDRAVHVTTGAEPAVPEIHGIGVDVRDDREFALDIDGAVGGARNGVTRENVTGLELAALCHKEVAARRLAVEPVTAECRLRNPRRDRRPALWHPQFREHRRLVALCPRPDQPECLTAGGRNPQRVTLPHQVARGVHRIGGVGQQAPAGCLALQFDVRRVEVPVTLHLDYHQPVTGRQRRAEVVCPPLVPLLEEERELPVRCLARETADVPDNRRPDHQPECDRHREQQHDPDNRTHTPSTLPAARCTFPACEPRSRSHTRALALAVINRRSLLLILILTLDSRAIRRLPRRR